MSRRVEELFGEYQDYLMADRLRRAVGGRLTPPLAPLALPEYATRRLRRQHLARALVRKEVPLAALREIDRLTDELSFGFWHNAQEVAAFLRAALRQGGHPALSDPAAFGALLSADEWARLGREGVSQVATHYQTCLSLAAPLSHPESFERVYARVEASRPPLFADGLPHEALGV